MSAAAAIRPVDEAGPANPVAVHMVGVRKAFGERIALDGADLSVVWGEVHALLGENGAGKSSLMNILAGFYGADNGVVEVAGQPVAFTEPRAASAAGIGMIHQHFKLVGPLTVLENLRLACGKLAGWRTRDAALAATAQDGQGSRLRHQAGCPGRSAFGLGTTEGRDPQGAAGRRAHPHHGRADRRARRERSRRDAVNSPGGWPMTGGRSSSSPTSCAM